MTNREWSLHSTINRESHAYKRRVTSHAFSDSAVRSTEQYILENIRKLETILSEPPPGGMTDDWSKKRDVGQWSTYLNFDVMGDLAFGKPFNCLMSETHRWVPNIMLEGLGFLEFVSRIPIQYFYSILVHSAADAANRLATFPSYLSSDQSWGRS